MTDDPKRHLPGDIDRIARSMPGAATSFAQLRGQIGLVARPLSPHYPGGGPGEQGGDLSGAAGNYGYDPYNQVGSASAGLVGSMSGGMFNTSTPGTPAPGPSPAPNPSPTPTPVPAPTGGGMPPPFDWSSVLVGPLGFLDGLLGSVPGPVIIPGSLGAQTLAGQPGWFGDGIDGDHTVAGTETLTQDTYYHTLIVPVGTTLQTNGWMVFCDVLCQVDGTISCNGGAGGDASNGAAGTAGAAAFTNVSSLCDQAANSFLFQPPSSRGKVGVTNANGRSGDAVLIGSGVVGSAGQTAGAKSGGNAGNIDTQLRLHDLFAVRSVLGGSSGSGSSGARDATSWSGGSGGAGGRLQIAAKRFDGSGTISAVGGAGGKGYTGGALTSAVNSEASPGGPGGVVILMYKDAAFAGTITVTGGANPYGGTAPSGNSIQAALF